MSKALKKETDVSAMAEATALIEEPAEMHHARMVEAAQHDADKLVADAEREIVHAGGAPVAITPLPLVERITAEQFSRRSGRKASVEIFSSEDRRLNGARKLTAEEWSKLFDAFQRKPR